jgi:ArsR family transcriptional regulator
MDLIPFELLEEVGPVLKTLSHPLRLRILDFLEQGPRTVSEITRATGKSQALTSHHLGIMRNAGVLKQQRKGTSVFYSLNNTSVLGLLECIRQHKMGG